MNRRRFMAGTTLGAVGVLAGGVPPAQLKAVIGRTLSSALKRDEQLQFHLHIAPDGSKDPDSSMALADARAN